MIRSTVETIKLTRAEVTIACEKYAQEMGKLSKDEQFDLVELLSFDKDNAWIEAYITTKEKEQV